MYQLIRDKIKELQFEEGEGLRILNTYTKILLEKISLKLITSNDNRIEYRAAITAFNEYLQKKHIFTASYFDESKAYILNHLEALITNLTLLKEVIPDIEYKPTYRDHLHLMLAVYEREHIGYFEEQPARSVSFYNHGRLDDHCIIIGNQFQFIKDSGLLPSMREDIISQVDYLTEQCMAQRIY